MPDPAPLYLSTPMARRSSPSRLRPLAALAFVCATALASSCTTAQKNVRPLQSWEYGSVGLGWAFRSGKNVDPVEEDFAFNFNGGYVLWDGRRERFLGLEGVRGSLDLGASFSRFDLDPPANDEVMADVYRITIGGRLERDLEDLPLTPWVRGGGYLRTHGTQELDFGDYDQDGWGAFAELGLLWWATPEVGIGPFAYFARDIHSNDLRETLVGITVLVRAREDL